MRLTLRQLQIFLAVCDCGSTAAAAEAVALSQSATSAALNELEDVLGVPLFDRVGKRLQLNDDGRWLLPQARQMRDAAVSIVEQYRQPGAASAAGLLIGASTTIGIYVLPRILGRLPALQGVCAPTLMIANTAAVAAAVADFSVDVGLIEGPCHLAEVQAEPWLGEELIIVCAPGDRLAARRSKVPLSALRSAGWLLREPGSGTREAVEQALLPHLQALRPAAQLSNSEAIKHAAAAGLGIACLPRVVVQDLLETGRLHELRTALPPLQRHFYLIHRRGKVLSSRLAGFLQACRDFS